MSASKPYPPIKAVAGLLAGTATALGGAAANTGNWRTAVAPIDTRCLITPTMYPVVFNVVAAGGETMKIQGAREAGVFEDVVPVTVSTGQAASTTLATGEYALMTGPWSYFRFVKSAGVALGTVAWCAAGYNPLK